MSGLSRWWAGWRPLVRIARRDALRARGRSALIVAMVALPILALTATDVLARSAQLDPTEKVARRLGQAQAQLEPSWSAGPVLQAPDPQSGSMQVTDPETGLAGDAPGADLQDVTDLAAFAPPGYRILTSESGAVVAETREGIARTEWNETAVGDPALAGRYVRKAGAVASGLDEVAVTSALFDALGVELGGTVRLDDPERSLTLTGVVDRVGSPSARSFYAQPGALLSDATMPSDQPAIFLVGEQPVTWATVQELNTQGLLVTSRQILLDPPARADVPFYADGNGNGGFRTSDFWFFVMLLVVVVVLSGLEVTLLAGAAFAVGARRQARSLGLLAAAGASRRQVRAVVLAGGLVLGLVGAVVGVALGLVLAAVARPVLTSVADADFGHYDVRPLELVAIAVLGLVTGLLAAVIPARTAARQDPVVALTGRRGQVRTARKVPVIGVVITLVGVGCAALGSVLAVAFSTGFNPLNGTDTALVAGLIAGGAALAQIGLIITSPAIIGLAGRWSRRLPLAGRLALRDAARHRGRSAPAMAAVLTAVTGSTALLLYVAALDAHDREAYLPSWPAMSGGVQLATYDYDRNGNETHTVSDPARVVAAITPALPPFESLVVRSTNESCGSPGCAEGYAVPEIPPENECFLYSIVGEPTAAQRDRADGDPLCNEGQETIVSSQSNGTPVGGPELVGPLTGQSRTPAGAEMLDRGGVVVFWSAPVRSDGTVVFDVVTAEEDKAAVAAGRDPVSRQVTLPATYIKSTSAAAQIIYSPEAAAKLGLTTEPTTLFLRFDQLPTTGQVEAAQKAMSDAGLTSWLSVERGYVSGYGLGLLSLVVGAGLITFGAAGIATGLAQADARGDHATLAAVGAAPRLRRSLAAAQALSISGLGTALGVAAGFVPAVALIGAIPSLDLVIPWWQLVQVMVVVPVLAAVAAWLLTRSRVPLERRLT